MPRVIYTILLVLLIVVFGDALKCYTVSSGNTSIPDTSSPQECAIGSLTCIKIVDFSRGTYTKQCQSFNCTLNGIQNSAANCANTSTLGVSGQSCCCYGDGCNSAERSSLTTIFGLVISAIFAGNYLS